MITVDFAARTLADLVVPYGPDALIGRRRWRVEPGSIEWSDPGRVRLLRDHVRSAAAGWAVELTEHPAGLAGLFRIDRGPAGDRVLAQAGDGTLSGLSPGLDVTDTAPDPARPGVHVVRRALLHEVSITASPAFTRSSR
ncbi:hypothetical protein ABT023_16265 [Micromonospora sp. NPDC002296]|uniref:hypothetical protein n=1 Tax=Micromonospora sp. NPDC002296 TaxID=3154271 RepID=UPI00331FDE14